MQLTPCFQLHLHEKPLPGGRVALGRFDGASSSFGIPCVAWATAGGKVFLHNPQESAGSKHPLKQQQQQQQLNINKAITALAAGALLPHSVRDVLLVGSAACLHAYDVEHNRDLFYRDVPEGVAAVVVGPLGPRHTPLAVAGGGGVVQGFDATGREVLWAPVAGAVTALALADVDGDGANELLVGCEDGSILLLREGGEAALQVCEADAVVALTGLGSASMSGAGGCSGSCPSGQGRWAYALANGTIGVYEAGVRLWRVKSKHSVTSLAAFNFGGASAAANQSASCTTVPHLVSGWSSGRVEARSAVSGEVVGRDSLPSGVVALLCRQLRDGGGGGGGAPAELQLLAVSSGGELRGYAPRHEELVADVGGDVTLQQRLLVELAQKKQQLAYELSSYSQQAAAAAHGGAASGAASSGGDGPGGMPAMDSMLASIGSNLASLAKGSLGGSGSGSSPTASSGGCSAGGAMHGVARPDRGHVPSLIPPDTRVDSAITINRASQACELVLRTNNDTVIRAALLFGEALFGGGGESRLVVPPQPRASLTVELAPRRDAPVPLLMRVLVGGRAGPLYHVFELDIEVPKFALYAAEEGPPPGGLPASWVAFELPCCPPEQVTAWLEARFGASWPRRGASGGGGGGSRKQSGAGGSGGDAPRSPELTAHFTCLRSKEPLAVRAVPAANGSLAVWLHCDSIALAGDLLQDLASRLGVTELASTASFPAALAAFRDTLAAVEGAAAARTHVESEAAGMAASIKAAVVRAEDARLLGDMPALRRAHRRLADLNRDMWLEHGRRLDNQAALLQGLRGVNAMIQAAAALRVGPAAARVVAACRAAVKANNLAALERLVCLGCA